MRTPSALFALAFLTGCTVFKPQGPTQAEALDSWMGHHYSGLIQSWGPPSGVYEDGQGGRVLVYSTEVSRVLPGYAVASAQAGDGPSGDVWARGESVYLPARVQRWDSYNMMYVRPDGTLYYWRTNRESEAEAVARRANDNLALLGVGVVLVVLYSLVPY